MDETAYVYIAAPLKDGRFVGPSKIGASEDATRRLWTLKSSSPTPLGVYCRFPVSCLAFALDIEKLAHRALGEHRTHGEWFDVDPPVAAGVVLDVIGSREMGQAEDPNFWILDERATEPHAEVV